MALSTKSTSALTGMYDDIVAARYYEERLRAECPEGKQPAFDISAGPTPDELHLAAGHEASGAGVCHHLRDDDTVTAPHHIAIAKGIDLKRRTAEIFGRQTGLGKGKGGHMHLFDPDVNFACREIIAQGCPPAVGAAMAAKKRNRDSVQELPVVFVVGEDNDWAISMPKSRITSAVDVSRPRPNT